MLEVHFSTFREKWLLFDFSGKVATFLLFDFSAFLLFEFSGSAPENHQLLFDFSTFRALPGHSQNRKVQNTTPNPPSLYGNPHLYIYIYVYIFVHSQLMELNPIVVAKKVWIFDHSDSMVKHSHRLHQHFVIP